MAKPAGASCNLRCSYCFYRAKEKLYPDSRFSMSDEVLEIFIRQYLEAHQGHEIIMSWQGGEPTLMGLDFFKRAITYERKYCRSDVKIRHAIQTNGTLLNDEWCRFFLEHEFLVGISIDGPSSMHDKYRLDKDGGPTFRHVLKGLQLLQRYGIEFNVLTAVTSANADHPLEVYTFLRDQLGIKFIQFIPIVERMEHEREPVTKRSVTANQWGSFLISVFDQWLWMDVGEIFIQMFDAALASWAREPQDMCLFLKECGDNPILEHNGDVYSCDHFVFPMYRLGNITDTHLIDLMNSDKQRTFGKQKKTSLPNYCRTCEVLFACWGECPKNRFLPSPDGENHLNYLCKGYRKFFNHIDIPMKIMSILLKQCRAPSEISKYLSTEPSLNFQISNHIKRNDPCPCGSGLKFKRCHGMI